MTDISESALNRKMPMVFFARLAIVLFLSFWLYEASADVVSTDTTEEVSLKKCNLFGLGDRRSSIEAFAKEHRLKSYLSKRSEYDMPADVFITLMIPVDNNSIVQSTLFYTFGLDESGIVISKMCYFINTYN